MSYRPDTLQGIKDFCDSEGQPCEALRLLATRARAAEDALAEARPYVFNRTSGEDWRAETAREVLERVDAALATIREEHG